MEDSFFVLIRLYCTLFLNLQSIAFNLQHTKWETPSVGVDWIQQTKSNFLIKFWTIFLNELCSSVNLLKSKKEQKRAQEIVHATLLTLNSVLFSQELKYSLSWTGTRACNTDQPKQALLLSNFVSLAIFPERRPLVPITPKSILIKIFPSDKDNRILIGLKYLLCCRRWLDWSCLIWFLFSVCSKSSYPFYLHELEPPICGKLLREYEWSIF